MARRIVKREVSGRGVTIALVMNLTALVALNLRKDFDRAVSQGGEPLR